MDRLTAELVNIPIQMDNSDFTSHLLQAIQAKTLPIVYTPQMTRVLDQATSHPPQRYQLPP